jgi:hypothetical protein
MTYILGLSGKKQSGKTMTANWIIGQQMCAMNMVSWIKINSKGNLVVPAVVNDELIEGVFDPLSQNPDVQNMLSQYVWPVVKLYSFAEILKMSVAAIFGLSYEQVNGSNEDKNRPTKFTWEMFKPFLTANIKRDISQQNAWSEHLSGRNLLQIVGTEIFRRIHGDIWVDACMNEIANDKPGLAIITDCRFPNEVDGVHNAGGKVIRFTRSPFTEQDQHESETALDDYSASQFDFVLDNANMSIEEHNKAINEKLTEWGYNTWKWRIA